MDHPHHYRAPFLKHLHSLARSNFFSRRIDADDRQFLEYVRRCGVANGSLPGNSTALLEELEFWHFPYSVAPGVERRVGRRPREEQSQEAHSLRQARSTAWRARRIIRENEKAIAEAELAREHREREAAEQKRRVREAISDAEWEAAAPAHAKFGKTVGRHHVPQWKLDEKAQQEQEQEQKRELRRQKLQKRRQKLQEQKLEQREREQEQLELERKQELERRLQEQELDKQKQEQEWLEREQAIVQARQALADANVARMNLGPVAARHYSTPQTLKVAIITLIKSVPNRHWMLEELTRALGCNDPAFIKQCVEELLREQKLWRHA